MMLRRQLIQPEGRPLAFVILQPQKHPPLSFHHSISPSRNASLTHDCRPASLPFSYCSANRGTEGKSEGSVWGIKRAPENRIMNSWFTFNST